MLIVINTFYIKKIIIKINIGLYYYGSNPLTVFLIAIILISSRKPKTSFIFLWNRYTSTLQSIDVLNLENKPGLVMGGSSFLTTQKQINGFVIFNFFKLKSVVCIDYQSQSDLSTRITIFCERSRGVQTISLASLPLDDGLPC